LRGLQVNRDRRRMLRAQWRDARVLLKESQSSLLLFLAVVLGGALALRLGYVHPETGQHPHFGQALYATTAMIFFSVVLPYPQGGWVQIVYYAVPLLALAAGADGVLSLGAALMNKQGRAQKWQVAMASTYRNHIIVCGLSRVGYRIVQELAKLGREVVAIESDPEARFVDKAMDEGIPVILADARRTEVLVKAGVLQADAILPCTDDELANLDIALDARELNPRIKVVLRMFDEDLARRVEKGFGIHTAYSTSALAAPIFAAAAMRINVKQSLYVGDVLLVLSEWTVAPNSTQIGWTVGRLEEAFDLSVICTQRGECPKLHPDRGDRLEAGETVLLMARLEALLRLNDEKAAGA
jgi:voltage-gated potassium channel